VVDHCGDAVDQSYTRMMADHQSSIEFPEAPVLVVQTRERVYRLQAGDAYNVGRDPAADVVVNDPRVSSIHAILELGADGWEIEDVGSRNGTFFAGRRVDRMVIDHDETFLLGHSVDGEQLACSPEVPPGGESDGDIDGATMIVPGLNLDEEATVTEFHSTLPRRASRSPRPTSHPSEVVRITSDKLRIGRAADNDVVVPDLLLSRHHAELCRLDDGRYRIADLGSHNGT
jgi:pSer/pThr/pTyr-binding forkhead associated (FHA) protein